VEAQAVKITVRTIPTHASIRIDGGDVLSAPYSMEVSPSKDLREITASAPSYSSVTRQVSFDQTREIVLELERASRQPSQRRTRARTASEPPTPTRDPEELAPPVKPREPSGTPGKRPRALDEDNPFAG
jgi:PEGA domain